MKSLWEELEHYSRSDYYPFHMPGHKRCPEKDIPPCYKELSKEDTLPCYKELSKEDTFPCHKRLSKEDTLPRYKRLPKEEMPPCSKQLAKENKLPCDSAGTGPEDIYRYDITEIEGFDNLHDAKGLLLSLQQKAASIYHAEESFFLVNGSTGGILSGVSALVQEGKKLLAARNCHKSVYNGIFLNRLQAEYLWPESIEEFDIQGEITAKQVKDHLAGREDICGVVVTSPTYDGIVSDIREIAREVHACHIPLIVDEAHGAHFILSEKAPESAAACGADIVINSVHKTLPALTQTALLHVQGELVDREKLKNYLSIYQSSSPSYLLMASIDRCMDFVAERGREGYERLLELRKLIEEAAKGFSLIKILPAGKRRDPGKLVISVKGTKMTGQELYRILWKQYHLQMEMAGATYVLGILTVMDSKEGVRRLTDALARIDKELSISGRQGAEIMGEKEKDDIYNITPAPSKLGIYEAMQKQREWVYPEKAAGRISGGFLYFYPPGIPFVIPGERISGELIRKVKQIREKKEYLTGISEEGKICVLKSC